MDPGEWTLADWLILATEHLAATQERVDAAGVTADDMTALGDYLNELAEHGHHLCALALAAIDHAATGHPIRSAGHGTDLQAAVMHSRDMFGCAIHFATAVTAAADRMTREGGDGIR